MKKLLASTLLLLTCVEVQAATLRCENGIADKGDSFAEVQQKCGAPVSQAFTGYAVYRNGKEQYEKHEWVYGPMRGGMLYVLHFEGRRLLRVDSKRSN